MLISKQHAGSLEQFSQAGRDALADILHRITARYDNLFETSFPYSMGFHQRPSDGEAHAEWHFHAHFYPPLLRSAVVRKFMVGYELLGTPQRDITPEEAAGRLRDAGEKQERTGFQRPTRFLRRGARRFSAAADLCAQRIRSRKTPA